MRVYVYVCAGEEQKANKDMSACPTSRRRGVSPHDRVHHRLQHTRRSRGSLRRQSTVSVCLARDVPSTRRVWRMCPQCTQSVGHRIRDETCFGGCVSGVHSIDQR
jgi:hypothetical protein